MSIPDIVGHPWLNDRISTNNELKLEFSKRKADEVDRKKKEAKEKLDAQDALTGKESERLHETTMQKRQRGGCEVGRDGIYRKCAQ